MRRFLVEAVIDAIIALAVILLLSLISVGQPFPFGTASAPILGLRGAGVAGFVIWAGILVLVNRFARPVLVALTGRLLLRTMGAFVVVINALAIYIAGLPLADQDRHGRGADRHLDPVAALVYTVLSTVTDAILGLNRPDFAPEGQRSIWRLLESLPTPRRNVLIENLRLQQVYDAIYATALDIALERTPIGGVRRWFEKRVLGQEDSLAGDRVRLGSGCMLQRLGPTYVKIGQMAASRADLLPAEWITELSSSRAMQARSHGRTLARSSRSELGKPPDELFAIDRPRAVRRRVDRPGPPGDAPRRDPGRGQGPAAADRGQDEGRPRGHPGARHGRRAPVRDGPQDRRPRDGQRVRRGRPQGARLPQRGLPRQAAGGRHGPLPRGPYPARLRRALGRSAS